MIMITNIFYNKLTIIVFDKPFFYEKYINNIH